MIVVNDTIHTIFAIISVSSVNTSGSLMNSDVSFSVFTILTGRSCETDMAYAVLAVDGNCRFAVLTVFAVYGDAVFAVDAYATLTVSTVHADAAVHAVLAVFRTA